MKKGLLILSGTLVVLTIACGIIIVAFNYYVEWRLLKEIKSLSSTKINGLYDLKIGNIKMAVMSGTLEANDITITTDSVPWAAMCIAAPDSFPPFIQLSVQSIQIRDFNWMRYFSRNVIAISSVVVDRPGIRMLLLRDTARKNTSFKDILSQLPGRISPVATALEIKYFSIDNARFSLLTLVKKDSIFQECSGVKMTFEGIDISNKSGEITFCRDIAINAANYAEHRTAGTHSVSFEDLTFSKKEGILALHHLLVLPLTSERVFFRREKYRKPFIAFACPAVTMSGTDINRLINENYLFVRSVRLDEARIDVSINKKQPLPHYKAFPHELIQKMGSQFNIAEVIVKNSAIVLAVNDIGGKNILTFNHTYITAANLTNDSGLMRDNHPLEMWTEMQFMNQSLLKVYLGLPLLAATFEGKIVASLGALSLAKLNPLIGHNDIQVKSGLINKVKMVANIRNGVAHGMVKMDYTDLEVQVLHHDSDKVRKVLSKAANLVLKSENNIDNDPSTITNTGKIDYRRVRGEGFLPFIWHAAQTGLIPCIVPSYEMIDNIINN